MTVSENAHVARDMSDWTVSIDELQALCPSLEWVTLVVAWFGDDLRAGSCTDQPEGRQRDEGDERRDLGRERADARDGATR